MKINELEQTKIIGVCVCVCVCGIKGCLFGEDQ